MTLLSKRKEGHPLIKKELADFVQTMLGAWRWVVLGSALAGAVLTPSTDPITMLLLASAITGLFAVGVGLVALTEKLKPETP